MENWMVCPKEYKGLTHDEAESEELLEQENIKAKGVSDDDVSCILNDWRVKEVVDEVNKLSQDEKENLALAELVAGGSNRFKIVHAAPKKKHYWWRLCSCTSSYWKDVRLIITAKWNALVNILRFACYNVIFDNKGYKYRLIDIDEPQH